MEGKREQGELRPADNLKQQNPGTAFQSHTACLAHLMRFEPELAPRSPQERFSLLRICMASSGMPSREIYRCKLRAIWQTLSSSSRLRPLVKQASLTPLDFASPRLSWKRQNPMAVLNGYYARYCLGNMDWSDQFSESKRGRNEKWSGKVVESLLNSSHQYIILK